MRIVQNRISACFQFTEHLMRHSGFKTDYILLHFYNEIHKGLFFNGVFRCGLRLHKRHRTK